MDEIRRRRSAMRRAVARAVAIVAVFALASPFAVSAQARQTQPERAGRPLLLLGVKKSGPLDEAATVGTLIPLRPLGRSADLGGEYRAYRGVVIEGAAGEDGFGLAAGWGRRLKRPTGLSVFGEDIMAAAYRTRNSLTGGDTTYVGGEVGLTMLTLRVSVGAATRVSGPEEADRTIFTWGVGFHIGR